MSPDNFDALVRRAEEAAGDIDISELKQEATKHIPRITNRQDWVRTFVTVGVTGLFILTVWNIVSASLQLPIDKEICHSGVYETAELIERLVSPVMFLVLGFYFGTERKHS